MLGLAGGSSVRASRAGSYEGVSGGCGRRGGAGRYQLAAMMALPRGLMRLDFGFSLILGTEDRFFFFWSSRPILCIGGGVGEVCRILAVRLSNYSGGRKLKSIDKVR